MHRPSAERGFTIAELAIALVLLSIGILAIVQVFPAGTRQAADTSMRTQAMQHANEKLEELATADTSGGALDFGTHEPESIQGWKRSYRIEPMPPPLDELRRVSVWVTWSAATPETVSLVSYWGR